MTVFTAGVRLTFVVLFLFTAVAKLRRPALTELAIVRLIGLTLFERTTVTSRILVRALVGWEFALAVGIAAGRPQLVGWAAAATMVVFVGVVARAWQLHVSCGCFPDRRPSEVGSIVRTSWLAALSIILALRGMPAIAGPAWWKSVLVAAALATCTAALYRGAARATSGGRRGDDSPTMVSVVMADEIAQIREARRFPPALVTSDEWLPAHEAAASAGMSLSTLLLDVAGSTRPDASVLLPEGSRPDIAITTTTGRSVRTRAIEQPLLLGVFSSTCDRCPEHIDAVKDRLTRADPPASIIVIAGPHEGTAKFTAAFHAHSELALVPFEDAIVDVLNIRRFPVFYLLGAGGRILHAADDIARLNGKP